MQARLFVASARAPQHLTAIQAGARRLPGMTALRPELSRSAQVSCSRASSPLHGFAKLIRRSVRRLARRLTVVRLLPWVRSSGRSRPASSSRLRSNETIDCPQANAQQQRRRHHDVWTRCSVASCLWSPHRVMPGIFEVRTCSIIFVCEYICCGANMRCAAETSSAQSSIVIIKR